MTKKSISRRGFLRGIIHTTGVAATAKIFKLFPEAEGVFASNDSYEANVWTLPANDTDKLMKQALNNIDGEILRGYLNMHDFTQVPDVYFAQRYEIKTSKGKRETQTFKGDILTIGYSNTADSDKGAMFLYVMGENGRDQWQIPMAVIQGEDIFYVRGKQITALKDKDNPLVTAPWFSKYAQGISPINPISTQDASFTKSPLTHEGPCTSITNTCVAASAACGAAAICCALTGICCGAVIGLCAYSSFVCGQAYNCCQAHPGTPNCS